MRLRSIVLFLVATTAMYVTAQPSAFADEYRGSFEQQMACTPDVWRFCSDQIPDADRIVACLRQNTAQLSEGCRAVFRANNAAPQAAQPRRRSSPAYGSSAQPEPRTEGWFR
jgi:hypothetical protein